MIDHFNRHPKTGRATELDPSTFANDDEALIAWAEELQTQHEDRGLDWLFICTWGGIFLVAGLTAWGIYEAALAVWEMM